MPPTAARMLVFILASTVSVVRGRYVVEGEQLGIMRDMPGGPGIVRNSRSIPSDGSHLEVGPTYK